MKETKKKYTAPLIYVNAPFEISANKSFYSRVPVAQLVKSFKVMGSIPGNTHRYNAYLDTVRRFR